MAFRSGGWLKSQSTRRATLGVELLLAFCVATEHLRILLDDEVDSQLLHCAALRLAQADVAIRVGRIRQDRRPAKAGRMWHSRPCDRRHFAAATRDCLLALRP